MLMRQWRVDVDLEHREVGVLVEIDDPGWEKKIEEINDNIKADWDRAMKSFEASLAQRFGEHAEVTVVEVF